jgi:hypothetical protein
MPGKWEEEWQGVEAGIQREEVQGFSRRERDLYRRGSYKEELEREICRVEGEGLTRRRGGIKEKRVLKGRREGNWKGSEDYCKQENPKIVVRKIVENFFSFCPHFCLQEIHYISHMPYSEYLRLHISPISAVHYATFFPPPPPPVQNRVNKWWRFCSMWTEGTATLEWKEHIREQRAIKL